MAELNLQSGTPIANIRQQSDGSELVQNIMNDYQNQSVTPPTYDPNPPAEHQQEHQQEHQHQEEQMSEQVPEQVYQENYDGYDNQEVVGENSKSSLVDELKPTIFFFLLFIVFNYEPIVLVLNNMLSRFNIPYLGLVVRGLLAAVIFHFLKKFI